MSSYSGPDDHAEVVNYVPAKQRPGLSLELFDRYWKDVHGPTCVRLGIRGSTPSSTSGMMKVGSGACPTMCSSSRRLRSSGTGSPS